MAAESFWSINISDVITIAVLIATIAAIIWGPIWALGVQADRENKAQSFKRKRDIAATLMRTRRMVMHFDHVGALNLIQLEFYGNKKVMKAFRAYIANLSDPVPNSPGALETFLQRRRDLFFDLLSTIGRNIGIKIDRLDLDRLAYTPLGWTNEENEQQALRKAALEVFEGRKALVVSAGPTSPPSNGPFPPPP